MWCYLYRAVESSGATIDFLSAKREEAVAERFLAKALSGVNHPSRYPLAIAQLKAPDLRLNYKVATHPFIGRPLEVRIV